MRTHIMLLAAAAMLTACADDQHPTSPATRSASRSGDVAPSTEGIKVPEAKPMDQVGFTKLVVVQSPTVYQAAGAALPVAAIATCPAGSFAVGGGYSVYANQAGFTIYSSGPTNDGTGWRVLGDEGTTYLIGTSFSATAVCIS